MGRLQLTRSSVGLRAVSVYAASIDRPGSRRHEPRSRLQRALARTAYWLLVLAVSLVFVFLLLAYFEARDASEVGTATRSTSSWPGAAGP